MKWVCIILFNPHISSMRKVLLLSWLADEEPEEQRDGTLAESPTSKSYRAKILIHSAWVSLSCYYLEFVTYGYGETTVVTLMDYVL